MSFAAVRLAVAWTRSGAGPRIVPQKAMYRLGQKLFLNQEYWEPTTPSLSTGTRRVNLVYGAHSVDPPPLPVLWHYPMH